MSNWHRAAIALLLSILLIFNLACPVTSGTAGMTPDQLEMALTYSTLVGLTLRWYQDATMMAPEEVQMGIPPGLLFTPILGLIGWMTHYDPQNEILSRFPILLLTAASGCVDFGQDGSCGSDDPSFEIVDNLLRFFNPYGGLLLNPGFYALLFLPAIISVQSNLQNPLIELPLRMIYGSDEWAFTLALVTGMVLLAHLPIGRSGGVRIEPRLQLANPTGQPLDVSLRSYAQNGTPMPVTADGVSSAEHLFQIPAKAALTVRLLGGSNIAVGWAYLWGLQAVAASLIYSTYEEVPPLSGDFQLQTQDQLIGEAGIGASDLNTCHIVPTEPGTAIALANPTSTTASISMNFFDSDETLLAENEIELGPMNQAARFAPEWLERPDLQDTGGTLVIMSNVSIASTALNTQNGIQTSSVPSATAGNR